MIRRSLFGDIDAPAPMSRVGIKTNKCFQRIIREQRGQESRRNIMNSLDGCCVRIIPNNKARPIILSYEWLGTMGRPIFSAGLFTSTNELLGCACFGLPGSPESRNICGAKWIERTICLERGACVAHAHPHAGSFLVSRACKLAVRQGFNIIYAYADPDAGEIGTIYQSCNWLYLGQGVGRTPGRPREYYKNPATEEVISSRALRHRGVMKSTLVNQGWTVLFQSPKHKYVWLGGTHKERIELIGALRYPPRPYPKRREPTL